MAWDDDPYDSGLISSIDPRIQSNPFIDEAAGLRIQNQYLDQQRRQQGGGREQSGKGSWYSQLPEHGWIDRQDKPGSNALGVPDSQQGIALPSKSTLGQWFDVTAPNGETFRLQQTDVGPSTRTGRGIDISAAAAHQMGYTPKDFPTDGGFSWKPANGPPSGAEAAATGSPAGKLGSVAAAPYGRPNMNDDNQAQPPGLMQSLFGGLFGGGQQQQGAGGVGGLIGAIDPQKMAYLGMIAKGLDPYSTIDPQAMLKNAQQAQQDAMDRQIRQQQLGINTRAQNLTERKYNTEQAQQEAAKQGYIDIVGGGQSGAGMTRQNIEKYLSQFPDSAYALRLQKHLEKLDDQDKLSRDYAQRTEQADKMGLQGQSRDAFITGMAGLNKPALTATDRKAIYSAEDALPAIQGTKESLQRALELNPDVLTGYGAGLAGSLQARLALDPENKKKGEATVEWSRIMSREAISQMSQALKGATTDFELKKFEDILGDPSTPVDVRKRTIERMLTLAQRHEKILTDRFNELRGGSYFNPGGGASKAPGSAAPESKPPVPNARQGKDGNWYVPNPAGGYYRVDQ